MARLKWDETGARTYETGVKNGVLYVYDTENNTYGEGVVWNGLTGVTNSPSGAEATALYADDIKYLTMYSAEDFGATIEAYTYPEEFEQCDGSSTYATGLKLSGQQRKTFAFSYVTTLGNDTLGNDYGYKIHIIYGCRAGVSERAYATINDSPEAITFSWEITTTPIIVEGAAKPVAHLELDSTKFNTTQLQTKLKQITDSLYGVDADATNNIEASAPTLLLPKQIADIINAQ